MDAPAPVSRSMQAQYVATHQAMAWIYMTNTRRFKHPARYAQVLFAALGQCTHLLRHQPATSVPVLFV